MKIFLYYICIYIVILYYSFSFYGLIYKLLITGFITQYSEHCISGPQKQALPGMTENLTPQRHAVWKVVKFLGYHGYQN